MIPAPLPDDEETRLQDLRSYQVLDTDEDAAFDDLTALAASICGTPIALVSLVDANRQWFKSHHGLNATETPRQQAFCAHSILQTMPFVVHDATLDPRFSDNPLVIGEPYVRFYAGAPMITPTGRAIGTLCVIDHVPRTLTPKQLAALQKLGRQAVQLLELRRLRLEAGNVGQMKSRFLATVSREIRTPLNSIVGTLQLLQSTALSKEQAELLSLSRRAGRDLLDLLNGMLDLSRLEAGVVKLESTQFDLRELMETSIASYAVVARSKRIDLKLDWRCKQPSRRLGDAQRLSQLVDHLIANAIKFTERGSVVVRVTDSPEFGGIQVDVVDTGVGIDASVLPKLFKPFVHGDLSPLHRTGSMGVGLAIAREVVTLMKGKIGAQSELEKGSRFWFEIPLPFAGGVASGIAHPDPDPDAKVQYALGGRSILVAEDEPINAMILKSFLEKGNGVVTVVENGAAAVEVCREREFDAILLDIEMPELNGFEVAERVRAMAPRWAKRVPIIAITANAFEGDRERCLLAGMTDYVTKPVDHAALSQVLERAFESKSSDKSTSERKRPSRKAKR